MKRLISLFVLCLIAVMPFTACRKGASYPNLEGVVQAVEFYNEYKYPVYTITTDDHYTVKVVLKDYAQPFSWIEKYDGELLAKGDVSGFDKVEIAVGYDARKVKKSSDKIIAVDSMSIKNVFYADVKTFSDGTKIGKWDSGFNTIYQMEDGTELIWIRGESGPDNVHVGYRESFDAFSEEAKNFVLKYYEERGLLYDADALVEQAYDWYKKDKKNFHTYYVSQEVFPTASNKDIMCFMTTVSLPIDNGYMGHDIRLGDIFDKRTGEHISGFDIFKCTPEEAMNVIIDEAIKDINSDAVRIKDENKFKEELKAAFKPEYIILRGEIMEVSFPYGSLPTEEYLYNISLKYTDEIKAILHDWAIPTTEW